jgi:hypothetical protein
MEQSIAVPSVESTSGSNVFVAGGAHEIMNCRAPDQRNVTSGGGWMESASTAEVNTSWNNLSPGIADLISC